MNCFLKIEFLKEKKLIGLRSKMSLTENTTPLLWKSFMTRRKEVNNNLDETLISLQVYDKSLDFRSFNPSTIFEKWAGVIVSDFNNIPEGMESYVIPEGNYAVFIHKGLVSDFPKTAQYIFGTWLPNSKYILDKRPHFEILGEKYKNNDPTSEEQVWIPIRKK